MHHHSFDSIIYFTVLLFNLNLLYYGLFNSCFSPFFLNQ